MLHKFVDIFAQLLLGLLAVIVPIFAVLLTVLARAVKDGRSALQETTERIFGEIEEVKKRSSNSPKETIKDLRKAVRSFSWRRRKVQVRRYLLSTWAAVYIPGLLFLGSLALLVPSQGNLGELSRLDYSMVGLSCALTTLGTIILCGVLETVFSFSAKYEQESKPETPTLEVRFRDTKTVSVWPAGSQQQCSLVLTNRSDLLAETILVTVFFPSVFSVSSKGPAKVFRQVEGSRLAGYSGVFWERSRLHGLLTEGLEPVEVVVPSQKGEYSFPVRIRAADVRVVNSELKVVVA